MLMIPGTGSSSSANFDLSRGPVRLVKVTFWWPQMYLLIELFWKECVEWNVNIFSDKNYDYILSGQIII